jgi:3D (Asp-Asp-Asp) domain-containing protein
VTLAAVAFPLTRSEHVSAAESGEAPAIVVTDGFSSALNTQATTLASALVGAGPMAGLETADLSLEGYPGAELVPRPVLLAAARVMVRGALAGPDGQPEMAIPLQSPVRFTIHEGGFSSEMYSTRPTVGAALLALGAGFSEHDRITPSADTPLKGGLHVYVERATPLRLSVGGKAPADVYTHAKTVADLLAERGVKLAKRDSVEPAPATRLSEGMTVAVTVVGERVEVEEWALPYQTYYRDDPDMLVGEYAETQAGSDGYVHREYDVVYENGVEVSRSLVSAVTVPPTHQVVAQGTGVPPPAPVAVAGIVAGPSGGQCARTLTVWATWYTAASAGGGSTATGTTVRKGTVAVDPRVIPLGTSMHIPGYGYGVAEDTGGAVIGNIIDLGYGPNDTKDWRSRYVDVCILN